MLPYFSFLIVILLTLYLYKKTSNKLYFKVAFFIIFLFTAFRGNGSGDYFTYLKYSNDIISLGDVFNNNYPMEIGFRIISYIKNIICFPDQTVIVIMAAISIYLTYILIDKYSKNKIISTIIFLPILLQFDMHASRSAIAASAGCLVLLLFFKKNYKLSLLFFLIGLSFHKSILVLGILMFVKLLCDKLSNKNYIFLACISIMISIFISVKTFVLFLSSISFLKDNIIITKLSNYFLTSDFSYPINLFDPRILLLIGIFFLSLVCLYFDKNNNVLRVSSYILLIGLLITYLFKDSTFLAYRLNSFYERNIIIILPFLLDLLDDLIHKSYFYDFSLLDKLVRSKYLIVASIYILYYIALVVITMVPYRLCI